MTKGRQARLSVPAKSEAAATLAAEAGEAPKEVHGVVRLSDGRMKLVGVPHDYRVGMAIPRRLADAWGREAAERGITKTDLFEEIMLTWLRRNGWKIGA